MTIKTGLGMSYGGALAAVNRSVASCGCCGRKTVFVGPKRHREMALPCNCNDGPRCYACGRCKSHCCRRPS